MPKAAAQEILDAIRNAAQQLGHPPSKREFIAEAGITEYQILQHFPSWREAVRAAGLTPDATNLQLDDDALLQDWGELVRRNRRIPTRVQYRREGNFSLGVFDRHFGPWSGLPGKFSEFAQNRPEWADVLPLLPPSSPGRQRVAALPTPDETSEEAARASGLRPRHARLEHRPTYGNPIDFRGLRHEPVNEQGVVFLFGMVARELGYMVEALQAGFPDCEAKRQVGPDKWQRVRVEFEFESRNFRDHGHPDDECDVIVCWRHNWPECPSRIEVVALEGVIESLAKTED
jgi:hypothetical protein